MDTEGQKGSPGKAPLAPRDLRGMPLLTTCLDITYAAIRAQEAGGTHLTPHHEPPRRWWPRGATPMPHHARDEAMCPSLAGTVQATRPAKLPIVGAHQVACITNILEVFKACGP